MTPTEDTQVDAKVLSFDGWYRSQHPKLLAAMTVVAADPDLGDEATAEAFTRALERWDRVSAMSSPGGWLYRTALHVVRRKQRRTALEHRLMARQRPTTEAPAALDRAVWDAVATLPERQRSAIALRYLLGLTQAEVADAMHIAPGTVSATLTAARRSLAPHLDPNASLMETRNA